MDWFEVFKVFVMFCAAMGIAYAIVHVTKEYHNDNDDVP